MPAAKGRTTIRNKSVYFSTSLTSLTSSSAVGDVVGNSKLVSDANLLPKVRDIGDIEQTSNSSEEPIYGQDTADTIVESPSFGQFNIEITNDYTNAIQGTFRGLTVGKKVSVALHIKDKESTVGETTNFGVCEVAAISYINAPGSADGFRVSFQPQFWATVSKA